MLGEDTKLLGDRTVFDGDGVRPRAPIATLPIMSWILSSVEVVAADTGACVGAWDTGAGTAEGPIGPTESHPGGAVSRNCIGTVVSC